MKAIRIFLILALMLSAQALASARGQARIGDAIVICSGASVTTIIVDADGQPVEQTHFCPDMALSLMAAIAPGAGWVAPDPKLLEFRPPEPIGLGQGRTAPAPRARAPPSLGSPRRLT